MHFSRSTETAMKTLKIATGLHFHDRQQLNFALPKAQMLTLIFIIVLSIFKLLTNNSITQEVYCDVKMKFSYAHNLHIHQAIKQAKNESNLLL
jgi:hypothetical protein